MIKTKWTPLCVLALSLWTSCHKRPNLDDELGNETAWPTVAQSILNSREGTTLEATKKGDQSLFQRVLYVGTAPRSVQSTIEKSGIFRAEDETILRLELTQETQIFSTDGVKEDEVFQHYIYVLDKKPLPPENFGTAPPELRFYNLQVVTESIEPPEPVRKRPDCRKTPGCQLHTKKVSFERILKSGERYQRAQTEIWYSPTVPPLANPIRNCQSQTYMFPAEKGSERRVPVVVRVCSELMDYVYGPEASPTAQSSPFTLANDQHPSSAHKYWTDLAVRELFDPKAKMDPLAPALLRKLHLEPLFLFATP